MLTEGYMIVAPGRNYDVEDSISVLILEMENKRPEFDFNTCLVSELNIQSVITIEGVTIVPYKLPKNHIWFVLVPEKDKTDED